MVQSLIGNNVNEILKSFNALLKTAEVHRLRPNETLWDVARSNGVTLEQLYEVNPGLRNKSPRTLQIGQRVNVPQSALQFSSQLQGLPLTQQVEQSAGWAGVDPSLFKAMITVESNNCTNTRSPKGARGCGQLMPDTAATFNLTNVDDPAQNLPAAAQYLRQMLAGAGGEGQEQQWNALMMYNWGPGSFKNWQASKMKSALPAEAKAHPKKVFDLLGWSVPETYRFLYEQEPAGMQPGVSKPEEPVTNVSTQNDIQQ